MYASEIMAERTFDEELQLDEVPCRTEIYADVGINELSRGFSKYSVSWDNIAWSLWKYVRIGSLLFCHRKNSCFRTMSSLNTLYRTY